MYDKATLSEYLTSLKILKYIDVTGIWEKKTIFRINRPDLNILSMSLRKSR